MTRNATEHLIVKKFTGDWHVWEGGGSIPSRWLSAHPTQADAFRWADEYVRREWGAAMPRYFVASDGRDTALWRAESKDDPRPKPVLYRYRLADDPEVWAALVEWVESGGAA